MGDSSPLSVADVRHLLRRTGFGASQADATMFAANYPTRGAAANVLLNFKSAGFKPGGRVHQDIHDKWVKYMLKTKVPLQEKLVLFWHDHFATGISKVLDAKLMSLQNKLFRVNCKGDFKALVKSVGRDPAMVEYLDTVRNNKDVPNENYARELQELFTLGVKDSAGVDNYEQDDVKTIARAFTGWDYDNKAAFFRSDDHDYLDDFPGRGPKVIYKTRGGFLPNGAGRDYTVNGEGAAEIDTVVDIIFQHQDSEGKNTVARRTARRLIEYFAHDNPTLAFIDAVVSGSSFGSTFNLSDLLHQIFVHDDFYLTSGTPTGAGKAKSVKWPIDYVVSSVRLLQMKLKGKEQFVDGGSFNGVFNQLNNMGQILFDPPSVFGWNWENSWISSATLLARYGFARDLIMARGGGGTSFRPERLMDLSLSDPTDILDAASAVLGISGDLTANEKAILEDYLTDGNINATLDLNDYDVRNTKLHGLFALLMQTAAYQLQ